MIIGERASLIEQESLPKTAWIFPGQGTQEIGMGQKLYEQSRLARQIYHQADEILGYPISQMSFGGPENLLTQTIHTQPAIFVYNHACFSVLQDQRRPGFEYPAVLVAGHSLGEYNALVVARSLSFGDALRLVQARAKAMQYACEINPGGMLVVVNLTKKDLSRLVENFDLEICTVNTDDQVVLGGKIEDLSDAEKWLNLNRHRSQRLNVAGAFHTTLMKPSEEPFLRELNNTKVDDASIPIIANTTAVVIQRAQEISQELLAQLTKPVFWRKTITYLEQAGVERTLEVGEKGILSKMHKKVVGGVIAGAVLTVTGITAAMIWHRQHQQGSQ